ncbi:hypothetical protein [Streptomyces sulfonofaciens]|nr:hypothetical protein [Streptomyces sulfonofaciens]
MGEGRSGERAAQAADTTEAAAPGHLPSTAPPHTPGGPEEWLPAH